MPQTHALIAECRRSLRSAAPLIAAQLIQMGHALADTLVAARLGVQEFAAVGLAGSLWFFSSLLCIGLLAGLSPLASEQIGRRAPLNVGVLFRQGLWLSLVVGLLACFALFTMAASFHLWKLDPELSPLMREHAFAACWGLFPLAAIIACRNICEATQITRVVFIVTLIGLVINLLGNLGLGLGWFGLPALGVTGIGLSTTLVGFSMLVVILICLRGKAFQRYALFVFAKPDKKIISALLALSIPIFFTLLFEAGLFGATMIQMGMISTLAAAAHTLAISATAFCYMFPLGLSFALTARVGRIHGLINQQTRQQTTQHARETDGFTLGARDKHASLHLRLVAGCVLTFVFAASTSLLLVLFRHDIVRIYSDDAAVREFATYLLLLAAVFQFSDAAQATLIGMLRGLQDARVPMLINAFSYWVIGFGLGVYLAHYLGWGATGLWVGLISGLTLSATLLGLRLWHLSQRHLQQKTPHYA